MKPKPGLGIWFRWLFHHPASTYIRPNLQLYGPAWGTAKHRQICRMYELRKFHSSVKFWKPHLYWQHQHSKPISYVVISSSCTLITALVTEQYLRTHNISNNYSAPVGEWSIAISLSVCVCVCVCLSGSISLELLDRSSQNFVCSFPVAVVRSSSGSIAICYVLLVLWITSCLAVMGRMGMHGWPTYYH